MTITAELPKPDIPEEIPDILRKATSGKSYFQDQLYVFDTAGILVYTTKTDGNTQLQLLEAIAGPLMAAIGNGVERYRRNNQDLQAVLDVHHNLLALGNFAKGFPSISDRQLETVPYTPPFKQMTEALLQALDVMKTQRVVRDSVRLSFRRSRWRLTIRLGSHSHNSSMLSELPLLSSSPNSSLGSLPSSNLPS
jgi:exportin-T